MTARARWAWLDAASCATRPDLPWIAEPADVTLADAARMAIVCASCPVRLDCDYAAASWRVTAGWWAGSNRDPAPAEAPGSEEPAAVWLPVLVGRGRRALTGALQGLLDIGGAA